MKSAIRKFSREYASKINESAIRGFVKAYQAEVRHRRQQGDSSHVKALPLKKPLLLGRIDRSLQEYIAKLREHGAPITTAVVIACARGTVNLFSSICIIVVIL